MRRHRVIGTAIAQAPRRLAHSVRKLGIKPSVGGLDQIARGALLRDSCVWRGATILGNIETQRTMQLVPVDLNEWTFDTVRSVVETHEYEPQQFDYKEVLNPKGKRDEINDSIRRTICSLANSNEGGFILFGVQDRVRPFANPADRIVGVPLDSDLVRDFGSKAAGVMPDVHFEAMSRAIGHPSRPGRGVFVVRIPSSPLRPHMVWVGASKGIFYKRGEGGSAFQMDVSEVRDQMFVTEDRHRKLVLLRLALVALRDQASRILARQPRPYESLVRLDPGPFTMLLGDVVALLPRERDYLMQLLAIPTEAAATNRLLEEARERMVSGQMEQRPDLVGSYASEVDRQVRWFDEFCDEVEHQLEGTFGALA